MAIANRHPRLRLDRRAITRAIQLLDAKFLHSAFRNPQSAIPAAPTGELSLVFLTDAALAQLHADFLADPTPTDVITFEGNPAVGTAGEICVSVEAALRHLGLPPARTPPLAPALNSPPRQSVATDGKLSAPRPAITPQERRRLSSFSAELTLYLVHGWLHLAGFDDLAPEKKRAMRRAEARAMRLLTRAGAVPTFTLRAARHTSVL